MKKLISILILCALLATTMVLKACGSRVREANLETSPQEVAEHLSKIDQIELNSTDPISKNTLLAFKTLQSDPDATVFYTEAPSSMGEIEDVAPLKLGQYLSGTVPLGRISKIYAFLVVVKKSDGFRGVLIIAGTDSNGVPTPTPSLFPSPTPIVQNAKTLRMIAQVQFNTPTPTPIVGPTLTPIPQALPTPDPFSPTFAFYSRNDFGSGVPGGAMTLSPGGIEDDEFIMDMNLQDQFKLTLHTFDVVDGDLAETVQFEIYDNTYAQNQFIGLLHMTQPK